MKTRYDFIEYFMRGFEDIFSFGSARRREPVEEIRRPSDAEALAGDWAKVYQDIERQMSPKKHHK